MQFMNMKVAAAILAFGAGAMADDCAAGSQEIGGNWYCQAVEAITYNNVGTAGTYNKVTHMASDGTCSSTPTAFSGPLSPLNEEVSLHFRGPLALKQLAVYNLKANAKRDVTHAHARRHGHGQFHKKRTEARSVEEVHLVEERTEVVATIDGQVVSWVNNYFGPSAAAPAAAPAATEAAPVAPVAPVAENVAATAPSVVAPSAPIDPNAAYSQVGYYNAESQTLSGLTFLGNYGGQGSGCWDDVYGNSLAYLNAAGTGGAASPQVLRDTTIPSNTEFTVMTDKSCDDGKCAYSRPGTVAYHGFDGADKVFLFEFEMPLDGNTGFNGDMPAIWMLNAQIPLTLQYGNAECSCWATGCGEFDIAESLSSGSTYLKSTLHTNTPGGDSDYFVRPTSGTMKLAVIFSSADSVAHIQVLPDSTTFDSSLTAAQVSAFQGLSSGNKLSLFAVSS